MEPHMETDIDPHMASWSGPEFCTFEIPSCDLPRFHLDIRHMYLAERTLERTVIRMYVLVYNLSQGKMIMAESIMFLRIKLHRTFRPVFPPWVVRHDVLFQCSHQGRDQKVCPGKKRVTIAPEWADSSKWLSHWLPSAEHKLLTHIPLSAAGKDHVLTIAEHDIAVPTGAFEAQHTTEATALCTSLRLIDEVSHGACVGDVLRNVESVMPRLRRVAYSSDGPDTFASGSEPEGLVVLALFVFNSPPTADAFAQSLMSLFTLPFDDALSGLHAFRLHLRSHCVHVKLAPVFLSCI